MNRLAPLLFILFLACGTEPEPLVYGKDVCHFCKMTLMDKKFGAELATKKGKVYKFDDANCFLNFYHSGLEPVEDFAYKLIVDYSNPEHLINAESAFYLKSAEVHSPMASEVAAFEKKENMDAYKKKWNGIYMAWGEVQTQFK